jgi:hypothetical protein
MTPKEFEISVHDLLRLQGWTIQSETLVGHKKVDCYATKKGEFGNQLKYLIECKYYSTVLQKDQIVKIYADYLPLLENKLANNILLVTENGVSPAGLTYIEEIEKFKHLTYKELINSIVNFDLYVDGLSKIFSENNLDKMYIPQYCDENGQLLEEYIINWINESSNNRPIAILGGYGMGKSTLSKRLTSIQSLKYKQNPSERIPIIIRLEEISTESKLEGLLGSHFTSQNIIQNYNFQLFLRLNELGKFLIILDGFDEMKKTMSWDALLYNLQQLNRLVVKNSKVILLGRPTAFLSEKEQKEALHGVREINNHARNIPDWPDYLALNIRPFSKDQIDSFISQYIDYIGKEKNKDYVKNIKQYLKNIQKAEGKRILDIATRPVQVKMLMEILPYYNGDIDKMTVATLYSEFIDLVIRRELFKSSRVKFTMEVRRQFAKELAYWMWQNDIGSQLHSAKVNDSLFKNYISSDEDDIEAIKRDLLMGSILERKPPTGFYFPHRSFQEFLVAEFLVEQINKENYQLTDCPFLTLEIQSFFIELISRNTIIKWRNYHEKSTKIRNENTLELLRTACDYLQLRYDSSLYKSLLFNHETTSESLSRRLYLVDDILSNGEAFETKIKKDGKKSTHNQQGKTPKHKYKK